MNKEAIANKCVEDKKASTKRPKTRREMEAEEDKRILYNAAILRSMPDDIAGALAKAKAKPLWCSDVRWRMELARRRRKYPVW